MTILILLIISLLGNIVFGIFYIRLKRLIKNKDIQTKVILNTLELEIQKMKNKYIKETLK